MEKKFAVICGFTRNEQRPGRRKSSSSIWEHQKKKPRLENYTKTQLLGTGGGTNVTKLQPSLGFELTPSVRELVRVLGVKLTGSEPAGSDIRMNDASQDGEMDDDSSSQVDMNESVLNESAADDELIQQVVDNIATQESANEQKHEQVIKKIMTKAAQKFVPLLPKLNALPNTSTSKCNDDATIDAKQFYEQSKLDLTFDDDLNDMATDTPPCKKKLLLSGGKQQSGEKQQLKPVNYFPTNDYKRSAARKRSANDDSNPSASDCKMKVFPASDAPYSQNIFFFHLTW